MKPFGSKALKRLQAFTGLLFFGSLAFVVSPLTLFVSVSPQPGYVVVKTSPPDSEVSMLARMGGTSNTTSLGKGFEAISLSKIFRPDSTKRSVTFFVNRAGFEQKELMVSGEDKLNLIREKGVVPIDGSVLTLDEKSQSYLGLKLRKRWPAALFALLSGAAFAWLTRRRQALMKRLAALGDAHAGDVAHPFLGVDVGEYRVTEYLGCGGMADVYKAVPRHLLGTERASQHEVVVKFCKNLEASQAEKVYQELQISLKIQHPNAVKIYEEGALPTGPGQSETQIPYLVMEYIPGQTLWELAKANGNGKPALALKPLLRYLEPAVEALQHAHNLGVVHRDVTPNNIMVTPTGDVKVLDFGLSKVLDNPKSVTTTATLGTPYYLSPEQYRRDQGVDARTDQFALGALIYQFLTGASPYGVEDLEIQQNLEDKRITLSLLRKNQECSPEVYAVVEKMLAVSPTERYTSIAEAFWDLKQAAEKS